MNKYVSLVEKCEFLGGTPNFTLSAENNLSEIMYTSMNNDSKNKSKDIPNNMVLISETSFGGDNYTLEI